MKLSVDIEQLKETAAKLEQLHSDYAEQHRKIIQCINATQEVWQGKDGEKFAKKALGFDTQLQMLENLINEYAQFLIYVSSEYDRVDNEIYERLCRILY